MTIRDILKNKGDQVWSVTPETTVSAALALMAERNLGSVLVLAGPDRIVGIFSERDFARKMACERRLPTEILVREVMTAKVFSVSPDETIESCMTTMTNRRFRHLPVVEGDHLVGLVSIGDVVKAAISDKELLIEQLEGYIAHG